MIEIKEKGVLITGAGRGIGKRLAMGLAKAGARVGLLSRTQPELDLAKLEIEHAGGAALALRADVRDLERMVAAVDRMRVVFGGIDVLIAAAAVQGPIGPLLETDPKAWAETIQINLVGVMHACRAVLPYMIAHRRGKIIVISGGGSAYARPNFSAYAASKTAVVRSVEALAEEPTRFSTPAKSAPDARRSTTPSRSASPAARPPRSRSSWPSSSPPSAPTTSAANSSTSTTTGRRWRTRI